jgi:hypothetical protein
MEADYIALSKAAKHFLLLKSASKDFRFPATPMALYCDNHSALDLAENYQISELSTYINIYHHRIWELVYDKTLRLIYIRTTDNLADMCTKGLPEVHLSKFRTIALGYNEGGC